MVLAVKSSNVIIDPDFYGEDYYEYGQMSGKSSYSHYRWMPELSLRMAMAMIDYCDITREMKIIDFGCAKGFLVKALRHLFREAYGCDWASYAIDNADPSIRQYLRLTDEKNQIPFNQEFDLCIAKDVMEHIPYKVLPKLFADIRKQCREILVVVPLGDGEKFIIDEYESDLSHIIREDMDWWLSAIKDYGYSIISHSYYVPGIKDTWYKVNQYGNAVIYAKREVNNNQVISLGKF